MAITFSSKGCIDAANDLNQISRNLDTLLNTNLNQIINNVKRVYSSESASELYAAFDKMKAKFPDFVKSVTDCSNYLANTVAPAYQKIETTAASKIG